jgi:hypothetical protein
MAASCTTCCASSPVDVPGIPLNHFAPSGPIPEPLVVNYGM